MRSLCSFTCVCIPDCREDFDIPSDEEDEEDIIERRRLARQKLLKVNRMIRDTPSVNRA